MGEMGVYSWCFCIWECVSQLLGVQSGVCSRGRQCSLDFQWEAAEAGQVPSLPWTALAAPAGHGARSGWKPHGSASSCFFWVAYSAEGKCSQSSWHCCQPPFSALLSWPNSRHLFLSSLRWCKIPQGSWIPPSTKEGLMELLMEMSVLRKELENEHRSRQ